MNVAQIKDEIRKLNQIDKVEISLQFLLYGFDENSDAHIYLVDGRESPKCYNEVGVWAIGSGAHAALSALAFHIDHKALNKYSTSVESAVYFAAEAKFMAESSGHVGKDATIIGIHRASDEIGTVTVLHDEVHVIKETWAKEGAPRVPPTIENTIKVILKAKQSDSETSEPAQ